MKVVQVFLRHGITNILTTSPISYGTQSLMNSNYTSLKSLSTMKTSQQGITLHHTSSISEVDGWMDGWLGFNGILSMHVAAISCLRKFKVC